MPLGEEGTLCGGRRRKKNVLRKKQRQHGLKLKGSSRKSFRPERRFNNFTGGKSNCPVEYYAEATDGPPSRPGSAAARRAPTRGRRPLRPARPAAAPLSPRPARAPTRGPRPARRSTRTRGGLRSGAPGPASRPRLPEPPSAPGEIRGRRGVWLSTSSPLFFP